MTRDRAFFLGILAVAAIAGAWALALRGRVEAESVVTGRPVQLEGDGYVASQTCQACHPSQYASWHRSYHRTMTQVATPDTVVAPFDGVRVDDVRGQPMRLERHHNELWAEFDDPDWSTVGVQSGVQSEVQSESSRTPVRPRVRRRVVMTTGSHHQQIYWYATGQSRVLGQLPAIWLTADRRWIPRRAAVMAPPSAHAASETGAWNAICVACHTTNGRPAFDSPFGSRPILTQTADTKAVEFGIACESCHGPAAEHAARNRNPRRRYALHFSGAPDTTIVQPERLDPRRASQVCGQCHAFWEFSDVPGERHANSNGLPYRPGDDLAATRFIVQPTTNLESPRMKELLAADAGFIRDIFWSDGMIRATGREYNGLIESPCFKRATDDKRTMSCFSCHSMHKTTDDARSLDAWADDQLAPHADGNAACVPCHRTAGSDVGAELAPPSGPTKVGPYDRGRSTGGVDAHTHHRPESSGSSCYNCHMPYTTYGLLKTIRSHQISNPSVQATLETGRPNACNLCHLDKTLAWTADTLEQWYKTPAPILNEDQRRVAASLLTLLSGDAGQRAIVAQSMGWAPAQQASGTGWLPAYLALFLDDPYDAVRYIASRSLGTLPQFDGLAYDYVAPQPARAASRLRAMGIWRNTRDDSRWRGNTALLINADGSFNAEVVNRLVRERNNRRVVYRE